MKQCLKLQDNKYELRVKVYQLRGRKYTLQGVFSHRLMSHQGHQERQSWGLSFLPHRQIENIGLFVGTGTLGQELGLATDAHIILNEMAIV